MSPTDPHPFAAVDLGASSGRVMLGQVSGARDHRALRLSEVHRFANSPVRVGGTLHWDVLALHQGVLDGLSTAGRATGGRLTSVGIDSWAVDYGLLDARGALVGNPVHYRDERTHGVHRQVAELLPPERLYATTGLQHLPFNTLYQLVAARHTPALAAASQLLLIPDLFSYWLTGERGTELTNASTTQLIDPRTRDWAHSVAETAGIDLSLFPPLRQPGSPAGQLLPEVVRATGLDADGPVPVTAVGSHDTASAVAGVPAEGPRFGYIATGTWSLAGLELDGPVLTEDSRRANFTNELGVDGTVRYLRNIMGLWLLQECVRSWSAQWSAQGHGYELGPLLTEAARAPALRSVVDAGDQEFLAPGEMPRRIAEVCQRRGEPVPRDPAELTRCVLDSLALAHRRALEDAQRLSGRDIDVVHIVGGGARNALLCQLTADACGLPVLAGPAEAAAYGNVLVQARAAGVIHGSLGELRALLRTAEPPVRYVPRGDRTAWDAAARRVRDGRVRDGRVHDGEEKACG